jgi:hypothetical protein
MGHLRGPAPITLGRLDIISAGSGDAPERMLHTHTPGVRGELNYGSGTSHLAAPFPV